MWEGKQLTKCERPFVGTVAEYFYSYDENGLRTQKRMEASLAGFTYSQTTDYYYNGSVLIGMNTGSTVMRFSYDASGNAVSVDYSTDSGSTFTTYYYLRNAQNDIVKLIDGSGNTVVEYLYDSWGRIIATTGSLANTVGSNQPFRYRGYVYDEETGWYYLQSRYYDPTTCRFISADVLLSTGQGVLGHNGFAYCLNNAVFLKDDGGKKAHRPSGTVAYVMTDGGHTIRFKTLREAIEYFKKVTKRWKNSGRLFYANIYINLGSLKKSAGKNFYAGKKITEILGYYDIYYTMSMKATIDSYGGAIAQNIELDDYANAFIIMQPRIIPKWVLAMQSAHMNIYYVVKRNGLIIKLKDGEFYGGIFR